MTTSDPDRARYEAAIEEGAEYYLPRFRRFAAGDWLSWNWAAFFGTFAWLRYRRLYAWSWAYLPASTPVLLVILAFIPVFVDGCQRALGAGHRLTGVLTGLLALGWIIPALFANRLYFARIRSLAADPSAGSAGGGHGGKGGIAAALAMQLAIFVAVVALVLPSYGDYTGRAMVTEAMLALSPLKTAITEEFEARKKLPENPGALAGEFSPSRILRAVHVAADGTIKGTLSWRSLEGHTILLVPQVRGGALEWSCRSDDLPDVCLPSPCRRGR